MRRLCSDADAAEHTRGDPGHFEGQVGAQCLSAAELSRCFESFELKSSSLYQKGQISKLLLQIAVQNMSINQSINLTCGGELQVTQQ